MPNTKKITLAAIAVLITFVTFAQKSSHNTKKGFAAEGYDVVAYFDNTAAEGNKEFIAEHDGVKYKFISEENLSKFKQEPTKYIPQYGGYCAYAVAVNGKKVSINPETYEIRDGKLYLFYNSGKTNTLELWTQEMPVTLVEKANKNWERIK